MPFCVTDSQRQEKGTCDALIVGLEVIDRSAPSAAHPQPHPVQHTISGSLLRRDLARVYSVEDCRVSAEQQSPKHGAAASISWAHGCSARESSNSPALHSCRPVPKVWGRPCRSLQRVHRDDKRHPAHPGAMPDNRPQGAFQKRDDEVRGSGMVPAALVEEG